MDNLVGIGLYTPADAGRLLHIPSRKIARWLRGHDANGTHYEPLWQPQVDLGDDRIYLGFLDLMEVRVAHAFMRNGVPAIRVRSAIELAREMIAKSHPLSTNRFLTSGRDIFLHVIERGEDGTEKERLLNLFKRQYEFKGILDPVLKAVDFDEDGNPFRWWPAGKRANIVVDPDRSFGAPIDADSSVPTAVLAQRAEAFGVEEAAAAFMVSSSAVRRAVDFEAGLEPAASRVKVLFDNCTSPVLASTLDGYISHEGHRAFHIKDVPGLPNGRHSADEEWLALLKADRLVWIFVTGDGRLLKNPALRAAVRGAGLHGFVLAPAYQRTPMHLMAGNLVMRWPELFKATELLSPPTVHEIPVGKNSKLRSLPL